jgi:integrase
MEKTDRNKDYYLYTVTPKKGKPIYYAKFRDPLTREILPGRSTGLTGEPRARAWAEAEYARRAELQLRPLSVRDYAKDFYSVVCKYCEHQRAEKGLSERTRVQKRRYVNTYILTDEKLMAMRLAEVTRADVEAFRARLLKTHFEGVPCRTAQAVIEVVKTILGQAVEQGLIAQNPIFRLPTGRYEYHARDALSEEQLDALLMRDNFGSDRMYIATMVAAATGMRAGEVRGLKWKDLDKDLKLIKVERALDQNSAKEQPPKWGKTRVCPYPSIIRELLEPLRADGEEFVFAWKGGSLNYQRWKTCFGKVCTKAGISTTLHGLRHTLNTCLLFRGISDAVIRAALGWSDPKIQERYTHITFGQGYHSPIIDSVEEAIRGETEDNRRGVQRRRSVRRPSPGSRGKR